MFSETSALLPSFFQSIQIAEPWHPPIFWEDAGVSKILGEKQKQVPLYATRRPQTGGRKSRVARRGGQASFGMTICGGELNVGPKGPTS